MNPDNFETYSFFQRPAAAFGGGPAGYGRRFGGGDDDEMIGLEEEDDIVAADLDMHSLILTSNPHDHAVISVHFRSFFWL